MRDATRVAVAVGGAPVFSFSRRRPQPIFPHAPTPGSDAPVTVGWSDSPPLVATQLGGAVSSYWQDDFV